MTQVNIYIYIFFNLKKERRKTYQKLTIKQEKGEGEHNILNFFFFPPKVCLKGRRHIMKKMYNVTTSFTQRPRISTDCMYITTRRQEQEPTARKSKRSAMRYSLTFCFPTVDAKRHNPTTTSKNLLGSYL